MTARLTSRQISDAQSDYPGWVFEDRRGGLMRREYRFADFAHAFGFMAHMALVAEKADHHPEWSNVYDRVAVTLTTHDVDGLSMKDLAFASAADKLFTALVPEGGRP